MTEQTNYYSHTYDLTAGECNAEGLMPVTLLTARIIEVATEHANRLGIGYSTLVKLNLAWVLSRVSIEIDALPGINERYTLHTWIESTNRLFSERCFRLTGPDGRDMARARTTWAAIDMSTRRAANPGVLGDVMFPENPPVCTVAPARRMGALPDSAATEVCTFRYCDLDFNRHVNTVRYIDKILNHWTLDWFARNSIGRFDISFHHECHYDENVDLRVFTDDSSLSMCELVRNGVRAVGAMISWRKKPTE